MNSKGFRNKYGGKKHDGIGYKYTMSYDQQKKQTEAKEKRLSLKKNVFIAVPQLIQYVSSHGPEEIVYLLQNIKLVVKAYWHLKDYREDTIDYNLFKVPKGAEFLKVNAKVFDMFLFRKDAENTRVSDLILYKFYRAMIPRTFVAEKFEDLHINTYNQLLIIGTKIGIFTDKREGKEVMNVIVDMYNNERFTEYAQALITLNLLSLYDEPILDDLSYEVDLSPYADIDVSEPETEDVKRELIKNALRLRIDESFNIAQYDERVRSIVIGMYVREMAEKENAELRLRNVKELANKFVLKEDRTSNYFTIEATNDPTFERMFIDYFLNDYFFGTTVFQGQVSVAFAFVVKNHFRCEGSETYFKQQLGIRLLSASYKVVHNTFRYLMDTIMVSADEFLLKLWLAWMEDDENKKLLYTNFETKMATGLHEGGNYSYLIDRDNEVVKRFVSSLREIYRYGKEHGMKSGDMFGFYDVAVDISPEHFEWQNP